MDTITLSNRFVQPEVVTSHFHIHEGDTVADFGCGSGYFTPALVEAVGPEGRVFTCDIRKNIIDRIGDLIRVAGWQNVAPMWCDIEAPGGVQLPDGELDVGVLINALFLFEDKSAALQEIDRTIRPGGKLCVVDWTESWAGLGPSDDMVVSKDEAIDMLEAMGYQLEREFAAGGHHYGLAFRKP